MSANYFLPGQPMDEYLADRGRYSGSALKLADDRPEDFRRWLKDELPDRRTEGFDFGSFAHLRILEPHDVRRRCVFYPNQNEAHEIVMAEITGPRGGKKMGPKLDAAGEPVLAPQDASQWGARKRMLRVSSRAKDAHREFMAAARGKIIVYPEDQPVVNAMVRAVEQHPEVAALLALDGMGAPEVTVHWTCPETGEQLQARPDWMRERERLWVELKTYTPKGPEDRLDTLNPKFVSKAIRQRWPIKSALLHDGCTAVTGDRWRGAWIVVEAVEHDPRVSVIYDDSEHVGSWYTIGRDGLRDRDGRTLQRGYLELVRLAAWMRAEGDYAHPCTRGALPCWELPGWVLAAMEADAPKAPPIKGARRVEVANG
jgi:hypothetical protein